MPTVFESVDLTDQETANAVYYLRLDKATPHVAQRAQYSKNPHWILSSIQFQGVC